MRGCVAVLLLVGCFLGHDSQSAVGSSEVLAQDEMDEVVDPCLKQGGGVMYCQGASMAEDNRKIDSDLNAAYKTLRNRLHGTSFERRLIVSERKWIRDRDKRCEDVSEEGFDNDRDRNAAHESIAIIFLACMQNELRSRMDYINAALMRLDKDGLEHFHF
jgi:uncharacterized protein YecT (DUF1311 family)